jgi:osmotically-inducible protein OsmY
MGISSEVPMRSLLLAGISTLSLFIAGCAGDSSIDTSIKMRLLTHLQTSALYIHPHTSGGVVTLTGGVISRSDREEAVRVARSIEGVREVHDELANRQSF